MEQINIAVTGINATDNPGPGSGIIRSIRYDKNFSCKIIGLSYDAMDPGNFLRDIVDISYIIPYPSQDPKVILERIEYIHSIERIDVLIPTLDSELLTFIKIAKDIEKLGIKMFLPTEESFNIRSKNVLADFCEKNNINVPKTYIINSTEQLYKMDISYPIYVKGIFYDAYMAYSFGDAVNYFNKIRVQWGLPVIVQEFINGEEFDIVALGDGEGNTIGAVPMKKMSLTEKKKAWAGITIDNPKLVEATRDIIKAIKWRGPMEAEIMVDSKTNKSYLIEINPRFPAWCFLSAGANQNLPLALVNLALGKDVTPFEKYDIGKLFVRYSSEVLADIKDIEQIVTLGYL